MVVGAFKVMLVPDVKPLIVNVSSEGIVRVCVDVTEQGAGVADVDVIEQDCAAAIWAVIETAATAQAAAPARANFRILNSGEVFSCVANSGLAAVAPALQPRHDPRFLA